MTVAVVCVVARNLNAVRVQVVVLCALIAVLASVAGGAGAAASGDECSSGNNGVTIAVVGVVTRDFNAVRVQVVVFSALVAVLASVTRCTSAGASADQCSSSNGGMTIAVVCVVARNLNAVRVQVVVLCALIAVLASVAGGAGAAASADQCSSSNGGVTIAVLGVVTRNLNAVRVKVIVLSALVAVLAGVAS